MSRNFFSQAAHPVTGLSAKYSTFTGKPKANSHHSAFDAHLVIQNMAMDYAWFSKDVTLNALEEWQCCS